MKYCPLSVGNEYTNRQPCFGEDCALAGGKDGKCLIKKILEGILEEGFEIDVSNNTSTPQFKPPIRTDTLMPWDY